MQSVDKITIGAGKRAGKPCVRGLRITVWDVLGWLGAGMTEAQILDEHPDLERRLSREYRFAAEAGRRIKTGEAAARREPLATQVDRPDLPKQGRHDL